jgi:predicted RNA methylase
MKLALDSDWPADRSVLGNLQRGTSFEGDVANAMLRVLREGDIAVDIGANIGYLTVLASLLVGPTGRVVAFEPDPENVLRLRANVALNTGCNVTIVEKAVTDRAKSSSSSTATAAAATRCGTRRSFPAIRNVSPTRGRFGWPARPSTTHGTSSVCRPPG